MNHQNYSAQGLYHPDFEHDACGIGFVANLKGRKSHDIITNALTMLTCMEHRGGTGYDIHSGDGAGILVQIPHDFFSGKAEELGFELPDPGHYGVGMLFFPNKEEQVKQSKQVLEETLQSLGLPVLGYRAVPTDNHSLGDAARASEPKIAQIFVAKPAQLSEDDFLRKLYVARKAAVYSAYDRVDCEKDGFYIASFSSRTVVYKGQLTTAQVAKYYLDLRDPAFTSALAMFHSRFSTNTFPAWRRAQPFRYLSHNGEINTVRGNINWMMARQALFESINFSAEELELLHPVCNRDSSDSANLDLVIELLTLAGRPLAQVMMMVIPEAWQTQTDMAPEKRAFYEYYSNIMEPWDGPASVSFTDGRVIGATLDRNGLRPSRFLVTDDDMVVMGSETGALCIDPARVTQKGRLQPGKIFIADLTAGRIISDEEIKTDICSQQPYGQWLAENKVALDDLPAADVTADEKNVAPLTRRQKAFGFTHEDINLILKAMVDSGKEPLGAMGADNPLAVLSDKPQHLANYFKQLFAQVTNPPIDPIREEMVMSLRTCVGASQNLLKATPAHCRKVEILQPVLSNEQMAKLKALSLPGLTAVTLPITFLVDGGEHALQSALEVLCGRARDAVQQGATLLVLSDREADRDNAGIPSLLATAAVHHDLIRAGLRAKTELLVEAADVRETHHFATLIGYGAAAVNPYLAIETLQHMAEEKIFNKSLDAAKALVKYTKAVNSGLLKIFSKMGISTLQSYQGAQIFEALGINNELVKRYFTGTISRIGGIGLAEIARETQLRHREGFPAANTIYVDELLASGGDYAWRHDGERHLFNPTTIRLLQHSTAANDYQQFQEYARSVDDQAQAAYTLRGLLNIAPDRPSISLEDVEPAENIYKRFATGAMSFGSISWEAHTTLAIAMNRLGGRSNSGEGGEDPVRFTPEDNGDSMLSRIKQVASGRFGVTSYYLSNCDEIQIKMAQGAKPGEGGQLPGHKVDAWIGRTRGSTPGVGLISPPPHHDIYSIEDLAQLIFDLKNANRSARINVKLVSEAGVGTIAAGVCKGYADVVLIAGYDGGTGASPLSSIKHAGLPWELGLAETHQTLVKNRLRSRIVVQADGQMKTPRDLAIATLLGAEEWGVATAALVVEGCTLMRKCHLNTCPVGIATQNKTLRERYNGRVEHVVNFFKMLTQGLREIMAELGFRTIDEMVGQAQCLQVRENLEHWKIQHLDLANILHKPELHPGETLYCSQPQKHLIDDILDRDLMRDAELSLKHQQPIQLQKNIINTQRSVGTMISNEISKQYGAEGLPAGTIDVKFSGSAGQSFAAFAAPGLRFELEGDANDYLGKGLSGAELVVYPPKVSPFNPRENILVGNVALFGATRGRAFIRGVAGERFCVRNSGAIAVVEGVGDHGCEYMTGGTVVILGETGRNFAAGMSGGVAWVFDNKGNFSGRCNREMVELETALSSADLAELKALIADHHAATESDVAAEILADWERAQSCFIKVMPVDYKRMQGYMAQARASGNYRNEQKIAEAAFEMHLQKLAGGAK
ncbi:glutamate synthase large subunit [Teredinibacter turnerae]|uniref:glutamate synthase large subunit n=1 Tax=Teredinibacter turnerae TaxID=2426 RepID=UPI00041D5F4C|nr:glutamate synthase large subunit [Teredinibacter turnerae]